MAQVILDGIYKTYPKAPGGGAQTGAQTNDQNAAKPIAVLRDISLTINDGEFMVLVGPSGCGKSTLLRMIAGLEDITAGKIQIADRLVNDLPPKDRDIAMVFQSYALYPHMTVFDNLAFGLRRSRRFAVKGAHSADPWFAGVLGATTRALPRRLRYVSDRERAIATHVHSIATMLQIEPLLHRLPKQLSGGQKQRVALGRAMARNPQVFLMDEPLSNLDAKLRAETRSQIVKLQRQLGVTTIYVTHDQTEAMTMGDRIAVMNGGILQQLATPLDLYHHPANRFVAEFMGSPPMNFIPIQVKAPLLVTHPSFRLTLPKCWDTLVRPYDGQMLLLGIRPEHLSPSVAAPKNLAVQVEDIEALGHETLVTVMLERERLQARMGPGLGVRSGDSLWLSINPEHIHLFHPETGTAI